MNEEEIQKLVNEWCHEWDAANGVSSWTATNRHDRRLKIKLASAKQIWLRKRFAQWSATVPPAPSPDITE